MSTNKMPIEHAVARSTVRLQAGKTGAPATMTGTGFFYQVTEPTSNLAKMLIITNKHVVKGADQVDFVLSYADSVTALNDQHQPLGRQDLAVSVALQGNIYNHPDPEIDLCGIDVTIPAGKVLQSGKQLRFMSIDSSWLPSQTDRKNMRDIEQVLVVGYPKGLWDEFNNMPISRVGTTATHPLARYKGKTNFLIDVSAFGGSSGSPVFTYEAPLFRQADGNYSPGTKVQFIGVIWGVVESETSGQLRIVDIPSALAPVPVVSTSLNLATALHGDAILAIDELIFPGITKARSK